MAPALSLMSVAEVAEVSSVFPVNEVMELVPVVVEVVQTTPAILERVVLMTAPAAFPAPRAWVPLRPQATALETVVVAVVPEALVLPVVQELPLKNL
jgi:hypothetical protein